MWRAIVEVWPQSAFKAKWPGAAETSIDKPNDGNGNGFFSGRLRITSASLKY